MKYAVSDKNILLSLLLMHSNDKQKIANMVHTSVDNWVANNMTIINYNQDYY
jgi:hypothetical protein